MFGYKNGTYSVARYNELEARANDVENRLDELRELWMQEDDEEVADDLYGSDISELEDELDWLQGEMGSIDIYWLTRDYYASVM